MQALGTVLQATHLSRKVTSFPSQTLNELQQKQNCIFWTNGKMHIIMVFVEKQLRIIHLGQKEQTK